MQVSEAIGKEAVFFLVSVLCGMGLVFVYDFFRILRRLIPHGNIWIGIEDAGYWLFCTASVFLLLYQENDGMMRGFAFLGMLSGGAAYGCLFSRLVVKISVMLLGGMIKLVKKIAGTILRPFGRVSKKISVFLRKRLKKMYKMIKIGLRKR